MNRRGQGEGEFLLGLSIGVILAFLFSVVSCERGYLHGQIDALNGNVAVRRVETDAGIFWQDAKEPLKFYSDRQQEPADAE